MGRTHGGVCRRDNRHAMSHITAVELSLGHILGKMRDTHFRIPHLMLRSRWSSLDLLQNDRLRPCPTSQLLPLQGRRGSLPLIVDWKEFAYYSSRSSCWVELADPSGQHCPCYTTWETEDVRVDSPFYSSALIRHMTYSLPIIELPARLYGR